MLYHLVMGMYPVSQAKEDALAARMASLGVSEDDIEESFIRSSGRGGQKVNKTSSCVYLKHVPTDIEVKCSRGRSQALNRYYARVTLLKKVEALVKGAESEERMRIEKIRRQKRKRSKRAKEKILADKKAVSEKKRQRMPVGEEDDL